MDPGAGTFSDPCSGPRGLRPRGTWCPCSLGWGRGLSDWNIPTSWAWMCVIGMPFGLVRVCLLLHRQAQPQTSLKRSSSKRNAQSTAHKPALPRTKSLSCPVSTHHKHHGDITRLAPNLTCLTQYDFSFPPLFLSLGLSVLLLLLNFLSHFCH